MENFRLKVFRAVAERLNFTQAAQALHLTQPAVTLQIKALESSLAVRLFDRTGGKVALTAAGELLLQYAWRIDELTDQARIEISSLTGEGHGRLSLGASTTIAQYILPPLVGRFLLAHARVQPFLYGANTEEVVTALLDKRVELAFIEGPPQRSDLKMERFLDDEIVAIAHPEHEFSQVDLQSAPLILRERGSGTRRVVEMALEKAGVDTGRLNVVMELDSSEAIKSAVEAGLGIGFVSQWALRKERLLGSVGILSIPKVRIKRQLNFLYAQGPEPGGVTGSFLQFAREYARSL
jgi:DNA-binding transcriptional LysR family regulator